MPATVLNDFRDQLRAGVLREADVQLTRICLGIADKLLQRLRRNSRIYDQNPGRVGNSGNRRNIAVQVEVSFLLSNAVVMSALLLETRSV